MPRMLFRVPLFHIIENFTFLVIFNDPFELKRLAFTRDKKDTALAASKNIISCFVKIVICNHYGVFAECTHTSNVDSIGNRILIYSG